MRVTALMSPYWLRSPPSMKRLRTEDYSSWVTIAHAKRFSPRWCHRSGLDPNLGVASGLAANGLLDPLENRRALASP
jgi:hypothetical protein